MSRKFYSPKVPSVNITADIMSERIRVALRGEFGDKRYAVQKIADLTGISERAIRNWWDGRNAPNIAQAMKLAQACDSVADEIIKTIQEMRCPR